MARRRRRSGSGEAGDSLDLLLDTICNTFGGVLFMAMLICLLSAKPGPPAPPDREATARVQLDALAAMERRELAESRAASQRSAAERSRASAEVEVEQLAQSLGWPTGRLRATADELADDGPSIHAALATQEVLADLAEQARQRHGDLERAQAELAARQAELDAARRAVEMQRRQQQVRLRVPNARETNKRQAVAYVHRGRVFAGVYPSQLFRGQAPHFRGHIEPRQEDQLSPDELPDRLGSPRIETDAAAEAALVDQQLAALDADGSYVMFAVWPDSHDAFRRLRDALTRRGIGYGLLLMEEGEPVRFGRSRGYEQ